MIFEFIKITNWRSFYGVNDFIISRKSDKNVTLIRAENGVGKTSLLAAINWCFFSLLPSESEFEDSKSLVNKFAIEKDGADKATVEIDFRHEGKLYRACRSYDQRTQTTHPLRLSEIIDGGVVPSSKDRPDRFINSVIPKEMAPHFFFYGEATSRYTGASGARKFGEAVKGILGSTVARMALEDLKKVMTEYNKQASDNTSDEARSAERGVEEVSERIAGHSVELEKLDKEIDFAEDRLDRLNQELAGAKPAREAQERRSRMEASLAAKETERDKAEARAKSWMQQFATAIISEELIGEASEVIKQEDTRGKLPAPYDKKFVDELLGDGICVCGRPLPHGSSEYDKIKDLLETAGDQAVMSRVLSTGPALGRLAEKAARAWSELDRNHDELRRIEGEIQRLDADIQEVSRELANNPITDVAEKEAARERARQQKRQAENRKMNVLALIKGLEREKLQYETTRDELVKKSEAARRFVKRAQIAAALTARLQSRIQLEEETARSAIERDIDAIVQRFMRKPVTVKLDKDYQLRLYDQNGVEVAKSTGENQLLGLAFTGAIAKYAKERENASDDILLPGTVAPLVVDSPFGHLDPLYRKGVAEFLPSLASQVILLVSTSQASDAVMETLSPKIGDEYVLTRHNREDGTGKQPETITIGGHSYDLTTYNSDIDGTRITEVK